jgi:hypothetical protein
VVKRNKNILIHNKKTTSVLAGAVLFLTALFVMNVSRFEARAYVQFIAPDPALAPGTYPTDDTAYSYLKFLNGSSAAQRKLGSLLVGTTGSPSTICLNGETSKGIYDSTNCVTALSDASALSTGGLLGLGAVSSANGFVTSDYVRQLGFIRIKNDNDTTGVNKNQRYSLIVEAHANAAKVTGATALYATDGPIGAPAYSVNWAGYYSGSVGITDGTWTSSKAFCLNGNTFIDAAGAKGCIRRWVDYVYGSTGLGYLALNPSADQTGRVAVTGSLIASSVQTGSLTGMPLAWTCGDGMCSTNSSPAETATSCPVDCSTVSNSATVTISSGDTQLFLHSSGVTLNVTNIVILRKAGSAPTSSPVDGVIYTEGQTIGDATIVKVFTNPEQTWDVTDSGLTNGVTYYYSIFSGSNFPRYQQPPVVRSAVPSPPSYAVTLQFSGITVSDASMHMFAVSGQGDELFCQSPDQCVGNFTPGSVVRIEADALPVTYSYLGLSGDCTGTTCDLTVDAPKSVTATFKVRSGRGGAN